MLIGLNKCPEITWLKDKHPRHGTRLAILYTALSDISKSGTVCAYFDGNFMMSERLAKARRTMIGLGLCSIAASLQGRPDKQLPK